MRGWILCCAAALCSGAAWADCTPADQRELRGKGMNEARIRHFCGQSESGPGAARKRAAPQAKAKKLESGADRETADLSNICQTPLASCALGSEGPAGATCWCNTTAGPARGRLRER